MFSSISAKASALISRVISFGKERFGPVALLWVSTGLGLLLINWFTDAMSKGAAKAFHVAVEPFADTRLIGLLLLGLVISYAAFGAIKQVIKYGNVEEARERDFFTRVLDEISSATTHIACALSLANFFGELSSSGWPILGYLILALFAFRAPTKKAL